MSEELKIIGAVLFIIVGAAHIFFPEIIWHLAHGVHDKNAEPGENTEIIYRIVGGVAAAIGIILLLGVLL